MRGDAGSRVRRRAATAQPDRAGLKSPRDRADRDLRILPDPVLLFSPALPPCALRLNGRRFRPACLPFLPFAIARDCEARDRSVSTQVSAISRQDAAADGCLTADG